MAAGTPPDLAAALDANPPARAFFATLTGANRYAVLWRLMTAPTEQTRARRLENLIAMLAAGEAFHCRCRRAAVHSPCWLVFPVSWCRLRWQLGHSTTEYASAAT